MEINGPDELPVPNMHVPHVLIDRAPTLTQYYVSLTNQHCTHAEILSRSLQTDLPIYPDAWQIRYGETVSGVVKGGKGGRGY